MLKRLCLLLLVAVSCKPKYSGNLPDWFLHPEQDGKLYGYGVSLPVSDTADATLQARKMAAAMLALSKEMRVSSLQSLKEDLEKGSINESSARFLSTIPSVLPPITKLVRLKGGVTVVQVADFPVSDTVKSLPLEISWFNSETDGSEEVSTVLVAGSERWEWTRAADSLSFIPHYWILAEQSAFDATAWKQETPVSEAFRSGMGNAEFTNQPGSFSLAFLSAYAHAVSHLSHEVQSNVMGSGQMFTRNRANNEVKTSSNTILSGVRLLGVSVFATASGTLKMEVTVGAPKESLTGSN